MLLHNLADRAVLMSTASASYLHMTTSMTVLLENLTVAQLVNSPSFMEPDISLPSSQEPGTGPDSQSVAFGPHTYPMPLNPL